MDRKSLAAGAAFGFVLGVFAAIRYTSWAVQEPLIDFLKSLVFGRKEADDG